MHEHQQVVPSPFVSRRVLLVGAAGAVILAACGSDSSSDAPVDSPAATPGNADSMALVRFFAEPSVTVGTGRRLVFGLADADGTLRPEGPSQVSASLLDPTGAEISTITGVRRDVNLPRAYYEFRVDVPQEGAHTLRVNDGTASAEASFTVVAQGSLPFPGPGDPLPPFDTPTVAAPAGVDPVCTRDPACPFHDITLSDALALLIAGVAIFTFGFFATHSISSGWVARRGQERRGLATAIYLTFYYLGASLIGSLSGFAWSLGRWNGIAAVLGLCLLLLLAIVLRLKKLPADPA